jgi:pimeloyl-ACP methyl ester carboxylesterase
MRFQAFLRSNPTAADSQKSWQFSVIWFRCVILVVLPLVSRPIPCTAENLAKAEIRLKNGTTLRGEFLVMNALAGRAVGTSELKQLKNADPVPHNIGRIDTGWQRIYFPLQQRQNLEGEMNGSHVAAYPVIFKLPRPKLTGQSMTVSTFGSMSYVGPFDEFGRRRITIATAKKPMDVFQSITLIAPDHVLVESTNCDWKFGLPLKSIPIETIEALVKREIKPDDAVARSALVRFYSQAELYGQAFVELEAIGRDFPDRKEFVDKSREVLMNSFGVEVLLRLKRRKLAGQYQLAETYVKKLMTQTLTGQVEQEVKRTVQSFDQARQTIEQVKLLLSEWQAKLNDDVREKKLQPMRSEINEQLDFETLPRLSAFIKAEADKQYEPSQRLALAYSGWVLGSANATPDLDLTFRAWDARQMVIDYLRSDDSAVHSETVKNLQTMESISPRTILNLIPQLPNIIDATDLEPGIIHQVETEAAHDVNYSVVLPAEYSPRHTYPIVVALRSRNRTIEQTLSAWAGDTNHPDLGHQRGYIVIAPHYAERNQAEHTYGAPAHKYVLDCLVDARKRFSVDSDRVFLTGHGMGADAAFDIALAHPDEFAGVLPIGGNAINYCNYCWSNGSHCAWYVVGKGYDSKENRDNLSNMVFDNMLIRGPKFDFLLVEYLGRNGENLFDDFSKLFDWMETHVRRPLPKEFDVRSLRKADNRFFWLTVGSLPRDYILPAPSGTGKQILPMEIEAKITPGSTVVIKGNADNITVRLPSEFVDFDKRLVIKVNSQIKFNKFVTPDIGAALEELRLRGDRSRLPLVVITPGVDR